MPTATRSRSSTTHCCKIEETCVGKNDAPRCWWNILDKALRTYGLIPKRADRCCYVRYSIQSRERAREHWGQRPVAQQNDTKDAFTKSREQSEVEAAFEKTLDPKAGSPATGKSVAGIINLFVDDLFGTGGTKMEEPVLSRLGKDFQVGSEDWNDVALTGQRIRWTQDSPKGPYIEVNQNEAIEELEEIRVERNTKEDFHCTPSMHTKCRSLYRVGHNSNAVTNYPDVLRWQPLQQLAMFRSLNKLARQIKSQPMKLQYWPLTGPLRILGFPDASYRNNDDGSSQRGMTVFLAESRERSSMDGMS